MRDGLPARLRSDVLQLNQAISAAAWPRALQLLRRAERNEVSYNAALRGSSPGNIDSDLNAQGVV